MKQMTVGADIAKNVMQLHYIDAETGEIVNKPVKRAVFLEHFANWAPCLIGMEACGGSQYWARKLTAMGHEVKLMPGKFVKAFVMGNKNDAVDAKAIWLAVQHAERSVAVKTETQQAVLGLHRMREQLVKFRTMQINGLLTEYGEVIGKGRDALDKAIPSVLERLVDRLPAILIDTLREQWNGLAELDKQIAGVERRLQMWMREDKACKAIAAIPGVGLLTATAAVATMGDAKTFRSGREFAAWIGLVPKQTGSGGKSSCRESYQRGDAYLRKLLIHGARAVLCLTKEPGPWAEGIRKRRPLNVAIVAQANRIARTIWAILAHDRPYEKGYVSVKPV
ncbi:IS110 family transposase [Burkholderia lata]|uniref:IS110 family transposase n=1 Tax=Burkholderia lata (strain ATCC 17760 / DSM 23089 / LMG 22485 / NCIMB 9086 / R18194 / 383) TaxID=482957 RepID=UPI0014545063|nr:IS110 family transposase [Burkholderia lata]VWC51139.1 putative transposase [Burkholderia lata]